MPKYIFVLTTSYFILVNDAERGRPKNNRRCAMAGFGGTSSGGMRVPKRRASLFLRLFLFRSFCPKRMKIGHRLISLSEYNVKSMICKVGFSLRSKTGLRAQALKTKKPPQERKLFTLNQMRLD